MTSPAVGRCGSTLSHQAFLYGSPDDFVASMAPFVRTGLERGDTVFGAAKQANVDALREELGDDADLVRLEDTTEWMTRPYERLQAFRRMVAEVPAGGGLSAMGEPVWEGSPAVVRQWARYESIINLALAAAPMRFVCLYDSSTLPDDILGYAVETHPERVETGGTSTPCRRFVAPERFIAGPPPVPPDDAIDVSIDAAALRRLLADYGRELSVPAERIDEMVLAASEMATNALRHGGDSARATVWTDDDEIVCQISDGGGWVPDPLVGWVPPPTGSTSGWGLPIARQLCSAVDIVAGENGTTVSLHFSRR